MAEKDKSFDAEKLRLEYSFDHGVNFRDRVIQITGPIGDAIFDHIDAALSELERQNKKSITIRINSPGGSVYDALAIVGRLTASPCRIITEGYGHVMSAAVLVLACGDKRRMSKFSWFMHHKSSYMVGGSHDDVVEEVQQMEREERFWARWMQEFSSQDAKFWLSSVRKKNFYATAEECLKLGVIDELI